MSSGDQAGGCRLPFKILLAAFFCVFLTDPPVSFAASWKVIEVREGDLLSVQHENTTRKVRLYGVACPLKGQPFNRDARMVSNFLSLQKNVEIIPVFNGPDGSVNALVRIEGTREFLNERLIGYGLAWVKTSECNTAMCGEWRRLEGLARSNFIGLWADPRAIPPWEWLKAKRMEILSGKVEGPTDSRK